MKYYEEYKGFTNEELVVLAQAGNRAARDYLVLKKDRMISTILSKYTNTTYDKVMSELFAKRHKYIIGKSKDEIEVYF